MSLHHLLQTYLFNLVPDKLKDDLNSMRKIMVLFNSDPRLADKVMDVVYKVKKILN